MELSEEYAGDVTSKEAFEILKNDKNSYLVDVRTVPEWGFVGVVDLTSIEKKPLGISWKTYPNMQVNDNFIKQVSGEVEDKDSKLFFLCKVGGRSLDAAIAMAEQGYKNCFNISHGFEGDVDENNHRGKINGWKAEGLPWAQS